MLKNIIVKAFKIVCVLIKLVIAVISLPFQIIKGIKDIISIIKNPQKA